MRGCAVPIEPATYKMRARGPVDPGVLQRILDRANHPDAGPQIAVHVAGQYVTFVCSTWRPIMVARLEDAMRDELGAGQELLEPA